MHKFGGILSSDAGLPLGKKGALHSELDAYIEEKNIPLNVTLEITLDCNLRCHHCYNFDRTAPKPKKPEGQALNPDELHRIIDEIYDEGCLDITLTGGEAMVHPHFFDFVKHIRDKHMGVYLKSNGMLLTPETVARLKTAGIFGIEISLYGALAETHDNLTRVPGSFKKIVDGIKNCQTTGIRTKVNFVLTSENWDQAQGMMALCNDLKVPFSLNPQITTRYDGTDSSLMNQLDRDQLKALYAGPLREMIEAPDFDPGCSVQCSCARGIAGVSSTGEVFPCIGAPVPSGNLRDKSFHDIWHNSTVLNDIRKLKLDDFETCKPCEHRPHCRRSSGMVYTNTGKYTGPEEWTCMEAEVIHEVYDEKKLGQDPRSINR